MKKHNRNEKKPGKTGYFSWLFWMGFLGLLLYIPFLFSTDSRVKNIDWQDFDTKILSRNAVDRLNIVNDQYAEVYIKISFRNDPYFDTVFRRHLGPGYNTGPHYILTFGSEEFFEQQLAAEQKRLFHAEIIPVTYTKGTNNGSLFAWWLPLIVLVGLTIFFIRRSNAWRNTGMPFSGFGKSNAVLFNKEGESKVTFADVAGLQEARNEVEEIIQFLKNPDEYTRLGAKIPKGVILVGPPGTGKTLLARAVAGEAQVPFFSISGSEFVEMFVGVGASRVRDLFKKAKEKAPCIIFIDEIDAIGRTRSRNAFLSGSNDERESTLNQLLTEMDGFGTNTGVIVLAATNRADILDPALIRPGRFDRHIYLELPNLAEREAIFKVHLKPLLLHQSISAVLLAAQTPGFSGADIANVCNEAALIAARRHAQKIALQDFVNAADRLVAGPEKKTKIITPDERKRIAYHEAGHALASWMLKTVDPLIKISIIPRGKSLGAAWYLPEEKQLRTKTAFKEHLVVALAGRAAEELVFEEISSGALDDLEKATKEAYMMVSYYGFDEKIGPVSFYDSTGLHENDFQKPYSEATGRLIDEEVRGLVQAAHRQAKEILLQKKDALASIAELLLKKEIIYAGDLEKILGKRTPTNG